MKHATALLAVVLATFTISAAPIPYPPLDTKASDKDWAYFGLKNGLSLQEIAELQRQQDGLPNVPVVPQQPMYPQPMNPQPGYLQPQPGYTQPGYPQPTYPQPLPGNQPPPPVTKGKTLKTKTPPTQANETPVPTIPTKLSDADYKEAVSEIMAQGATEQQATAFIDEQMANARAAQAPPPKTKTQTKPVQPKPDKNLPKKTETKTPAKETKPPKGTTVKPKTREEFHAMNVAEAQQQQFIKDALDYGLSPAQAQAALKEALAKQAAGIK